MSKNASVSALMALTLWLNGFGCSFCCVTAAAPVSASSAGVSLMSDCCRRAHISTAPASAEAISGTRTAACSLLPSQAPAIITHGPDPHADVATAVAVGLSCRDYTHPVFSPGVPLPLNRGATYLRCCVLLI